MAKEDKANVKMTVIHFETESDNETLKENIRSIAHTIVKAISTNPKVIITSKQLEAGSQDGEVIDILDEELIQSEFDETGKEKDIQKKKPATRQYRTPQTIDIIFNSGDITFKDFVNQKNPDNDNKKYLVVAYWLKKYGNTPDVSADHVYTCFRYMTWTVPPDVLQPFRNLKARQYGWMSNGSAKGTYTINHLGENEIEKMGVK
jgi:hypothetical protein